MQLFAPVERPADRTTRRWVLDALAVAAAAAFAVPPYVLRDGQQWTVVGIIFLVAAACPLIVRRIYPVPVFAVILIGGSIMAVPDHHAVPALPLLISLYTIASLLPQRVAITCGLLTTVIVAVGTVDFDGGQWWLDVIPPIGLVVAALGLGLYSAARRAYLSELQERTHRLERELDQQGKLAAAAERTRITREIHDIVAHHLTVMVTLSDAAVATGRTAPDTSREVMEEVSATGRRALAETRRLLGVLRRGTAPDGDSGDALDPLPGIADLDVLVERVRAAGLTTTYTVTGESAGRHSDLAADLQLAVYRVVQEALTNTLKHAGPATAAHVELRYQPTQLRVQVDDDGLGTSVHASIGAGGGLIGMRERMLAYGGTVESGPRRTGGWRVTACLPLDGAPS